MKNKLKSIPSIYIYALPLLSVFSVYLLAYWPGLLVSDALYQWDQVQKFSFDNWHPVFNTLFIWVLTRVINSPTFVLFVQIIIFSFAFSYALTKVEKYYKANKKFLFCLAVVFALIPLNANFSVLLLKDILYSIMILIMSAQILCIINDEKWLKKKFNIFSFSFIALIISLFRHNGIIVVLFTLICLFFFTKFKTKTLIIFGIWIVSYLFLNTVVVSLLNVTENTYMNKYGPIAHIYGDMLNNENVHFSDKELKDLSYFVDIQKLKATYQPYLMDPSINCQNLEALKTSGNEFLIMGIKKSLEYPFVTINHYVKLTSFLYSPVRFKDAYTIGMFVNSDLWVYKDTYPSLETNSKLPKLLLAIKIVGYIWNSKYLDTFTTRPALYIYFSIFMTIVICFILKSKKIFLFLLPSIFNILSLAISIPAHMTRYVYSSMLIFWIAFAIFIGVIRNNTNLHKKIGKIFKLNKFS